MALHQLIHRHQPAVDAPSVDLEITAIDRQRRRFATVLVAAMLVSFVHMAAALLLFSRATWYETAAALAMTALVDAATWTIAEYLDYAYRRQLARSRWIKLLFGLALMISMFLNGAYLYAYRPEPTLIPEWMSVGVAVAFAVFVPLLIAVSALARGELTDDRLQLQQGTHLQVATAETIAQLHAQQQQWAAHQVALETELAQGQQLLAQERQQRAQETQALTEQLRRAQETIAQHLALHAQLQDTVAQRERELAEFQTSEPLDRIRLAHHLIQLGESQRTTATLVGMRESTLRNHLKALRNGHGVDHMKG